MCYLKERLLSVLPIADLYIATFSSTIIWSTLCGIKTVILDFYGFNYEHFDFLHSITKINNKFSLVTDIVNVMNKNISFEGLDISFER